MHGDETRFRFWFGGFDKTTCDLSNSTLFVMSRNDCTSVYMIDQNGRVGRRERYRRSK